MLLPRRCPLCGAPGEAPCPPCRRWLVPAGEVRRPPGIDGCRAVFRYEGPARVLIGGLKYRNQRSSVAWLASQMAERVDVVVDQVTWVPCRPGQRSRRGFDQGEVLARRVAWHLGVPARAVLRRRGSRSQTGRSAAERHDGPELERRGRCAERVLLVDDVMTTGASLRCGAEVLRRAGAERVDAVVAGATPLKVDSATADVWVVRPS